MKYIIKGQTGIKINMPDGSAKQVNTSSQEYKDLYSNLTSKINDDTYYKNLPEINVISNRAGEHMVRKALNESGKNMMEGVGAAALVGTGIGGLVAAPLPFIGGMAGGMIGDYVTNKATQKISGGKYQNWGEFAGAKTGVPSEVMAFTNPGAIVGGGLGSSPLFKKGIQSTGKYLINKAEPYLLGDKKIPMSGYKPKTNLINLERTIGKVKSNTELSTLFDNNFEINQRGVTGELPSRIKIKGKSGQLEAIRNSNTGEYMFHNNMPSQLEAGKAMLTLDKYLPKNAVIKETGSLSLDSYNNLLNFNRRKGWKLEPTNEYIDLNSSHKNSKLFEGIPKESNIGGFIDRNDAVEAMTRVNNMLKQKGFTQQADIKPLADGYYYNLALPNFKAKRLYKQGGIIHIKPENKGKFTETKARTGKTTEELTHSKNPITKKRAIFAQNAKKWKHQEGGLIYPKVNDLINRTNQKNIDFVNRLKDPKRKFLTNWENPNQIITHKMSWATDDKGATIYPNVQNIKGKLVDFTRPPYNKWAGYNSAIQNNDTIKTTPEIAQEYTTTYKKFYPTFNK